MGKLILTVLALLGIGSTAAAGPSSSGASTQGPSASPADSGASTIGMSADGAPTTDGKQYPPR